MGENTLNIEELVYIVKKKLVLMVIVVLGFTLIGFFVANYRMETKYRATAKVFAGKTDELQANYSVNELNEYKTLLDAYVDIVNTEEFYNKVLSNYGIVGSGSVVRGGVSFSQLSSTPILQISYTSTNQAQAIAIVNAVSNEFGAGVQSLILNTNIRVIEEAKCVTIVPNRTKTILIAFMAGLIVALGIVFILDYLDNRVRNKEELEKLLNVPVIGEIPTHSI